MRNFVTTSNYSCIKLHGEKSLKISYHFDIVGYNRVVFRLALHYSYSTERMT